MIRFAALAIFVFLSTCRAAETLFVDKCDLDPEVGFCLLDLKKYFYNPLSNKCETFSYSGCGGNDNRFNSKYDCENSCVRPPIGENGDDAVEGDEDEVKKIFRWSPPNLLGKLFQKSLFATFDLFKPDPLFDVFQPDDSKDADGEYDDNNDGDEEEENTDSDGEKEEKVRPFGGIFDIFHSSFKPKFDLFPKRWTRQPFETFWTKTLNGFREKVNISFEEMSRGVEKSIARSGIGCEICKMVVTFAENEIKIVNVSIEIIAKATKLLCQQLQMPLAKKLCQRIAGDLDEIAKSIKIGLNPNEVCVNLEMCPNTTLSEGVTQSIYISSKRTCTPLCNIMKTNHEEKAMKMIQSWNASRTKLESFCNDNKIIKKCDIFFTMFDKVSGQLSGIIEKQTEENCKCFNAQPVFETKQFDSCLRCKQFEKGMVNEAERINQSIIALAYRVKEICDLFPSQDCSNVVSELRKSLNYNTVTLTNFCNVTGYCGMAEKISSFTKSFDMLRKMLPDPNPIFKQGMGLHLKKFSQDCLFCKKCMGDLKETFNKINITDVDSKGVYPSIKEGFSLYCQTRTVGTNYTTICKKISDGIETVHKAVMKRGNGEGMCKILGAC